MGIVSLEAARARGLLILFDTNVLISAFDSNDRDHIQQLDGFRLVERNRRFTSELVVWQFLQPVSREDKRRRAQWLQLHQVAVRDRPPPGHVQTMRSLVMKRARKATRSTGLWLRKHSPRAARRTGRS